MMSDETSTIEELRKSIIERDIQVSNYIDRNDSYVIIERIIREMVNVVGHTLGPYGTSNLIQPIDGKPATIFSTKDGFEAINNIRYSEPLPSAVRDSLKDLAYHMQKTVGDGTTSGYPIMHTIYKKIISALSDNTNILSIVSPVGICNLLDAVLEYFNENIFHNATEYVRDFSQSTDEEKLEIIRKIAAIAANNDYQIAKTVTDLFANKLTAGEELGVDLQMNQEEEDIIDPISGFELMYGFTDEGFATEPDRMSMIYEDVAILVIKGKVHNTDKETITDVIKAITDGTIGGQRYESFHRRPLIICADSFSENIIAHVLAMKNGQLYTRRASDPNNPFDAEVVKFPVALFGMSCLQGNVEQEKFYDFATAVGATPVDAVRDKLQFPGINTKEGLRDTLMAKLGHAERVEATMYGAKFFKGNGKKEEIEARIKYIEDTINSQHANTTYGISLSPIQDLRSRIAMLNGKMSRIKIGGINIKEKQRRRTVYDDVVRSVQSAIRYQGYTLGGNINISWVLHNEKSLNEITEKIANKLINERKNIFLSVDSTEDVKTTMQSIVKSILILIGESFLTSYKYTMLNAFNNNEKKVEEIIENLLSKDKPHNLNLLTGEIKGIEDSELIVPLKTDVELMRGIFTVVKDLTTVGSILMFNPIDTKFKDYFRLFNKF